MSPTERSAYVLDSSAIIDLAKNLSRGKLKKTLIALAKQQQLVIPEGVFREIARVSDKANKLLAQLNRSYPNCVVRIHDIAHLPEELQRIERTYGATIHVGNRQYAGFWGSPSGRKAADGQVVAVGKMIRGIVVTGDQKIELVCLLENVPHIGWTELVRRTYGGEPPGLFSA